VAALVLYWTLTGSTLRVAERIASGLRAEGVDCELHDLRSGPVPDAAGYSLIGIGFPVHWYRPPTPVTRAITDLGRLDGKPVFAFTLNGTYRGAGLNRARRALSRAGGVELGAFNSYGEGHFYPYARLGAQFSPGHPSTRELDAAFEFGRQLAAAHRAVRSGSLPPAPRPFDGPTHPMYALERLISGPRMTRLVYSRFFRADPDRCARCGTCAKGCPVGNISWRRGDVPSWGRECVLCLNCVTVCPQEAVRCPLDWRIFQPFVRWNVNRAWRDPGLEHAHVEFRRGRITRVQEDREHRT